MILEEGKRMDIQVTGKNLDISPAVRSYITRKLGKIDRYLTDILAFEVVASEEGTRSPDQRFIVQVTINNKGTLLRGEERGQDVYTAVDKVAEVLGRQIEHYKGKLPYSKKRSAPSIRTSTTEVVTAVEEEEEVETGPRVVKNKKFDVKPMSLDEAVDQMELLGHDFFLFYNPDVNNMSLLYRRKDGNYGLIEPEIK
jgi:putative sigma-54 modulation protein